MAASQPAQGKAQASWVAHSSGVSATTLSFRVNGISRSLRKTPSTRQGRNRQQMTQAIQQPGPQGRTLVQVAGAARRLLRTVIVMTACSIHRTKRNIPQNDHGIDPYTTFDAIGRCRELFLTVGREIASCHGAMIGTGALNHNHILYAEMWGRICALAGAPLGWHAASPVALYFARMKFA